MARTVDSAALVHEALPDPPRGVTLLAGRAHVGDQPLADRRAVRGESWRRYRYPLARRGQRRPQRLPHRAPMHPVAACQRTKRHALLTPVPSDMLEQLHPRQAPLPSLGGGDVHPSRPLRQGHLSHAGTAGLPGLRGFFYEGRCFRKADVAASSEERELAAELIGEGELRRLMFFESAEGGIGVCEQLLEPDGFARAAARALELCHFDADGQESSPGDSTAACYDCLLAYENQPVHHLLDRRLVRDLLLRLSRARVTSGGIGESREEQYQRLRSTADPASSLEREFLDFLYEQELRLPDQAQYRPSDEVHVQPDFYYEATHTCVFIDGAVHDQPSVQEADRMAREALANRGFGVVEVRPPFETAVAQRPDVFGARESAAGGRFTRS